MTRRSYGPPPGGLPTQDMLMTGRAVFTDAYAVIPNGVLSDIVASRLPGWRGARAWILARPMSGFAETFCQMLVEVASGGGSDAPEPAEDAEAALFVTDGSASVRLGDAETRLTPGGFAFIPAGRPWRIANAGDAPLRFHWIRKRFQPAHGLAPPDPIFAQEQEIAPNQMPNADAWSTTLFMDPEDLRHDMAMTIVNFEPGGTIPFEETHVMEHGLAILQGKGVYKLNRDWVEVEAGDFLWLRAFCPQACYAAGPGPFRYLLYKDVNRLPNLSPPV